jgi:DNA-binding CsgD family transcriptional regulator
VGKDSTQWMKLKSEELRIQNLATGNYRLQIQMVNQEDNTYSELEFDIVPSWIDTAGARILILAIVILLIAGSQFIYRWYYKRIQKDLLDKKQQQITALKNEKLNQEIKSKGKELANSTLSLVKKNELLNQIKDALKNVTTKTDVANVLRLIDANIEKEDDWELLKSAFNNVDKDFMKALHEKHDNLTHNDLRLCTYLRLNLSSKEIAQLLNISTKSVEVKRYRLRKKLDLAHEQSLTDYIMNLK